MNNDELKEQLRKVLIEEGEPIPEYIVDHVISDIMFHVEKHTAAMRAELQVEQREVQAQVAALQDTLVDVLNQACQMPDGSIDSCALSAYADGLRLLAKHGRFTITDQFARRVIGTFVTEDKHENST